SDPSGSGRIPSLLRPVRDPSRNLHNTPMKCRGPARMNQWDSIKVCLTTGRRISAPPATSGGRITEAGLTVQRGSERLELLLVENAIYLQQQVRAGQFRQLAEVVMMGLDGRGGRFFLRLGEFQIV